MKLWLIKQPENNVDYDDYDSAVVVAESAEAAKLIHPSGGQWWVEGRGWVYEKGHDGSGFGWTYPVNVSAELVGEAVRDLKAGSVVCASFNAG